MGDVTYIEEILSILRRSLSNVSPLLRLANLLPILVPIERTANPEELMINYEDILESPLIKLPDFILETLTRKLENEVNKALASVGINLTTKQLQLLMLLEAKGRLHQREIGKYMALNPAAISRLIKRILKTGYVIEFRHQGKKYLELSDNGKNILPKAVIAYKEGLKNTLGRIPTEELELFLKLSLAILVL